MSVSALRPLLSSCLVFACTMAGSAADVDFESQVAPILAARCVGCHQSSKAKGGLDLSTLEAAIKGGDSGPAWNPGDAAESEIVFRIKPDEPGGKPDMPRQGDPLSDHEVALISQWVDQGAHWPETVVIREKSKADSATWWSMQKLVRTDPPTLPADFPSDWSENPIDAWIAAGLKTEGLRPSPQADKRTLLRRLTYDLTGLPPTPEEMKTFLDDTRSDAYERRVDQLLSSPRYGERWGRYWLDVVRFGESNGFERNVLIDNAWPFRDYVIRSLNQDKPFGQLVKEHLAGDTIAPDYPADKLGVAFLTVGPYDDVGNQDPVQAAQIRANTVDDMIVATGSAFLGLTIGCARCHDHKFDPILQSDYYKLQSAFAGARQGSQPLATAARMEMRNRLLQPLESKRNTINAQLASLEKAFQERVAKETKDAAVTLTKPVVDPKGVEESFPDMPVRKVRLTIFNNDRDPNSAGGTRIDELELWSKGPEARNVALAIAGATIEAPARMPGDFGDAYAPELMIDGKYGAAWISPASPAVVVVTLEQPTIVAKMQFSSDRSGAITGRSPYNVFVGDYLVEISADGVSWSTVADSSRERPAVSEGHEQARRRRAGYKAEEAAGMQRLKSELADVDRQIAAVPDHPAAWMGNFTQPAEITYIQLGGDPQKKGEPVTPGSLSYLNAVLPGFELPPDAPEALRRKALADWIASPDNALTWRVLANRIWYLHFGTGLVDTPGDFGYMGGRPSHPELLDWLAARLIASGGRLKPLHREIVMSRTYRQSSMANADGVAKDSQSRLLWRYPPRRLEGEQIRDSMLSVAGVLDETRGGPGFRLYRYLQDNVATYVSLDDPGPETWRRTVYHQAPRAARVDYLSDFDCPDNAQSAPSRTATTTPLQSMTQWNHRFTIRMAERLIARVGDIQLPAEKVERLYEIVFQRSATDEEKSEGAALALKAGWVNFARVLLNSNEFLYVE